MAIRSPLLTLASTTAQQYQAWVAGISGALDGLGVTKTSDSGQLDVTNAAAFALDANATAINSNQANHIFQAGYEIRQLASAGLQTIYLRFDYGYMQNYNGTVPNSSYYYPYLKVSIGTATNGAGVLSTIQPGATVGYFASTAQWDHYSGSSSNNSNMPLSAGGQECDFASDGQNYLSIMLGEKCPSFENFSILSFGIERTINPTTGQYSGDGMCAFSGHSYGNMTWVYMDFVNQLQHAGAGAMPSLAPPFNVALSPLGVDVFPFVGSTAAPQGAPTIALSYYSAPISTPVSFPATLYSTPHNYVCCSRSVTSADAYNTGTRIALRFD